MTSEVDRLHDGLGEDVNQLLRFSMTDYAAREIFYTAVNATNIQDPEFVQVWNLLDILALCGERELCGPELPVYLVEELLESQTTDDCRTVFDFLESRRERLFAKDFHKKNLILLRSCNELLKRLSRAEDAIFCGRVFFFLFQTFPLGDKSSVNLRGEFHVENTTKFEVSAAIDGEIGGEMDVDAEVAKNQEQAHNVKAETPQPPTKPGGKAVPAKPVKKVPEEEILSTSDLYPIFWRLQQDFSDPTRLFASENFATFKKGLASTLTTFEKTPTVVQTKAAEDSKRGVKRKLGAQGTNGDVTDHFVDKYNPKYLTSRDLFDLELSDLAFQRHIMVQALILIDFLLSLTEKVKQKDDAHYAPTTQGGKDTRNKSVVYSYTLKDEDAQWAISTRTTITSYLQSTTDGRFYHRMVETVLARDKNWVRWKVEACPSILRDPVSAKQEMEARAGARGATRVRRVPDRPTGAMDLSFLAEGQGGGLAALKDPARFTAPTLDALVDGVRTDKLDLEFANDADEKTGFENTIANKTWRALRHVRATELDKLNRVEPGKDLEEVFRAQVAADPEPELEQEGRVDGEPVERSPDANEALAEVSGILNEGIKNDGADGDAQKETENVETSAASVAGVT